MLKNLLQTLKDLFTRNRPTLIMGLLLVGLFLFIILLDTGTKNEILPDLRKISQEEAERTGDVLNPVENQLQEEGVAPGTTDGTVTNATDLRAYDGLNAEEAALQAQGEEVMGNLEFSPARIDSTFGVREIVFTSEGFTPLEAKCFKNQRILFRNSTGSEINIVELTPRVEEFKNGVRLQPGETIEFRSTITGVWRFKEETTKKEGSALFKTAYPGSQKQYLDN